MNPEICSLLVGAIFLALVGGGIWLGLRIGGPIGAAIGGILGAILGSNMKIC